MHKEKSPPEAIFASERMYMSAGITRHVWNLDIGNCPFLFMPISDIDVVQFPYLLKQKRLYAEHIMHICAQGCCLYLLINYLLLNYFRKKNISKL